MSIPIEFLMHAASVPDGRLHRVWTDNHLERERALCGFRPRWGWLILQIRVAGLRNRPCARCSARAGGIP